MLHVIISPKLVVNLFTHRSYHLHQLKPCHFQSLIKKDWFIKKQDCCMNYYLNPKVKGYQTFPTPVLINQRKFSIKPRPPDWHSSALGYWSLTCSAMVFVAVILGGVTRLTESGLSMVSWSPLGEEIPVDEDSWIDEFEKYKRFPEFKQCNKDMEIDDFKRIWWMEYLHRMWGRLIGLTFLLPASYFWFRGILPPVIQKRLLLLGILIGCQGLMGWYMVKSGLEDHFTGPSDIPRVSQYRLAAHLSLALTIYVGLLHTAFDFLIPTKGEIQFRALPASISKDTQKLKKLQACARMSKALVFLTAISGAFVAGLDAGLIYNSFPKMSDRWIPDDIFIMSPVWKNFTENPTLAQFNHRILGIMTLSSITFIALVSRKAHLTRQAITAVKVAFVAAWSQVMLGILTLTSYVPTSYAALHQSGSLIVMSSLIWLCRELKCIRSLMK